MEEKQLTHEEIADIKRSMEGELTSSNHVYLSDGVYVPFDVYLIMQGYKLPEETYVQSKT